MLYFPQPKLQVFLCFYEWTGLVVGGPARIILNEAQYRWSILTKRSASNRKSDVTSIAAHAVVAFNIRGFQYTRQSHLYPLWKAREHRGVVRRALTGTSWIGRDKGVRILQKLTFPGDPLARGGTPTNDLPSTRPYPDRHTNRIPASTMINTEWMSLCAS